MAKEKEVQEVPTHNEDGLPIGVALSEKEVQDYQNKLRLKK